MTDPRVEKALARFDRVTAQLDTREGAVRDAAHRERQRLNAGLGRTFKHILVAVGLVTLATIVVGLISPIGIFGLLAAIGVGAAIVALIALGGRRSVAAIQVTPDLPNGEMVQRFDSYLFRARRALPAPAQSELDRISAQLPPLRQTLERVAPLDPMAQDARRLMSVHLPGLIDRYLHVPEAYRGEEVKQRLAEGLAAGREALSDIGESLAKADLAAFETQGRFIETRYKDEISE
jgi:hypothetical protein